MTDAFSDGELEALERENPNGLSSEQIVVLLTRSGIRFTEATLRKYVQYGLLPRSRRVGLGGRQRGSVGLYPAFVVRRILRLKALLVSHTIEEIQREFLFARAAVEELERTLQQLFLVLSNAAKSSAAGPPTGRATPRAVTRELSDARSLATELVAKVTSLETRLALRARFEREAV